MNYAIHQRIILNLLYSEALSPNYTVSNLKILPPMKGNKENIIRTLANETPSHAYILWKTGEVLGFNMKEAAQKMGIGATSFRTNMRNRFVCKISVVEFMNKLNNAKDLNGPENINSDNYERKEKQTVKE